MSAVKDLLQEENRKIRNALKEPCSKFDEVWSNIYNFLKYAETDDISYVIKENEKLGRVSDKSSKENVEPNISIVPERKTQKKAPLSADSTYSTIPQNKIKQEKLSVSSSESMCSTTSTRSSKIKRLDEMPAPSKPPPRKKKIKAEPVEKSTRPTRSTRTKPKRFLDEEETSKGKSSDVVIQNSTIPIIDISDKESDKGATDDEQPNNDNKPIRTTRTKTRQQKEQKDQDVGAKNEVIEEPSKINAGKTRTKQKKRVRSSSTDENASVKGDAKRSKSSSSSDADQNKTSQTDYEDAVSEIENNEDLAERDKTQNLTMVINSTVVVEHPKVTKSKTIQKVPEPAGKDWKTPPRSKSKKEQIKEIFSPYEKTSLKKKVEAFEKFGSASKESASASKIPIIREGRTSSEPVKVKPYTPFSSKFAPKTCSTSKKTTAHNDSGLSMKSLSAMKASAAEFREREKRRREKEKEAQMKKEALLQTQAEEKRRKREEKELKVQQQRELLQKEKEKQLETQKLKEEKHKQAIAEKEERMRKTKEEAERKRLLAKNKAKIEKEKEEQRAEQEAAELAKQEERNQIKKAQQKAQTQLPAYMVTRAPLLPTDDCYDSDDDGYMKERYEKPQWCTSAELNKKLHVQLVIGEKIKNTLFCCTNHSPDLADIFEHIDPRKLKRTSSAVWKKPPRYTLFSMTSDIQFSEDSDAETDL